MHQKALALPARMRRAEQQPTQRHARALEHQKELEATAAEAERLKAAGELAQLRARVTGQEKVALAEADGASAAAELQAQTTLAAARRAATEQDRRAALEEAAEETAQATEADRKTAEERARITRAEADEARATADEAAAKARTEEAAQEIAARRKAAAADLETAAETELRAAETARFAAETRAAAAHAEALSSLDVVQIKTRVAARVLLADPQADGATLAAALGGASASRTSDYRKAALGLIAQGYPEHDPDLTTTPAAGPATIPGQNEITI
ncbi:hypothetical protein [Streptomyces nitrosporeus]|nr:hypothetical protein [Streptomyces nitrosporeus]